ncbi:MAG: hypothetical protein QOJ30_2192 [Pseudonocardiales bacterium]|jgi:amino acid transporter|nr:hypothetical protein [Pseudonocardiales bacterium]
MVNHDVQPGAVGARLAAGTLKTRDAVAISVSILAPGMAMLLNVPGVAAVAGGSTPLAFLLGGCGCLALAFVVVGFTGRMAGAGYAYTYISRGLGRGWGFLAGWLYAFGVLCFVPMTMAAVAYLACDLLGLPNGWWSPVFVVGMVALLALAVVRVAVTTRVQLLLGALTVALILVVDVVVTVRGGAHGNTWAPFTFDHTVKGGFSGVFYGIILGITSYIGFETAADFGEETDNPRRAIPVAVLTSVVLAMAFYLWTTYGLSIGFGVDNGATFGGDSFALKTVATRFVGPSLGVLVELGALLSAFVVCVGCASAATRTMYAMAREGVLPARLATLHRRFQTPVVATVAVTVLGTVLALLVGYRLASTDLGASPAISVYYFFATLGTLVVIVVYIGLCVAATTYFRRAEHRANVFLRLLAPVIGTAVFGVALFGSIYPTPTAPLNLSPYLATLWLLLGIAVLAGLRIRRPDAVASIGTILGEEGA